MADRPSGKGEEKESLSGNCERKNNFQHRLKRSRGGGALGFLGKKKKKAISREKKRG